MAKEAEDQIYLAHRARDSSTLYSVYTYVALRP